jgi:hypothetical protein
MLKKHYKPSISLVEKSIKDREEIKRKAKEKGNTVCIKEKLKHRGYRKFE